MVRTKPEDRKTRRMNDSKKLKVVQICAAPGTGKNGVCRELYWLLDRGRGQWLLNDNEFGYGGYSPLERHLDSKANGIALDSKEFAQRFNLPRQLQYQQLTRNWAVIEGRNIIMPGPFENLFAEIPHPQKEGEKIPLLHKMREFDFADFTLITIQLVLVPIGMGRNPTLKDLEDPEWVGEVAGEFERRLRQRIEERTESDPYLGKVQQALDREKLKDVPAYVRARLSALISTHEKMGTPLVPYAIGESPLAAAKRILVEYVF
ncbi:MAG: hypothetical protein J5J00_16055 [Deltaproteobacteria bacterium]|nr:hypothetical protein [Deltaproteobacteria bacterium]